MSDERYERGIEKMREILPDGPEILSDSAGKSAPDLVRYVMEFAYGDVYSRPGLDPKTRQIAVLGILGIATLGFFIDSGLQDIRLDRALFLIIITAFLNIGVDILLRNIRARLRLSDTVEQT